jgi:tripartite-type tricarboxylate transporter receptor subunit TctC
LTKYILARIVSIDEPETTTMTMNRRTLLTSAGAVLAASYLPDLAAQGWAPTQPVKMIVPFPPGGATDLSARNLAPKLGAAAGQSIVVDNKTGAGGAIGAVAAARSAPDGHTLLLHTISMAIQPSLIKDPGYDLRTDFSPVTMLMTAPLVLLVHPSVPATTVPELVKYAKEKGDGLFFGSAGPGSAQHLVGEMFNRMAGTKMRHVPFRGNGPATTALLAGEIQVFFDIIPTAQSFAQSGKVRALATTGKTPSPALPNLPTVQASGLPEFEFILWQALFLPKGAPGPIVQFWLNAAKTALADKEFQARTAEQGFEIASSSPEQLAEFIRRDATRWAKLVADIGIKGDN